MPGFLRLTGHPVRWQLLSELARSDRQVRELTALVGQRQSLTSYHLRQLREGGLVTMRRSSADKRDAYYSLDLAACRARMTGRRRRAPPRPPARPRRPARRHLIGRRVGSPARVLFLCTGNSSRSQMAEALLERLGGTAVDVVSAGSHPKPVHPNAVRVMRERGIDIRDRRSKHVQRVRRPSVRPRDQPVRPGPGGVPGVSRRARGGALEHRRSGCGRHGRRAELPGVRAHRRRAVDAHRLPAVGDRSTTLTSKEVTRHDRRPG